MSTSRSTDSQDIKIVFVGPPGAGKSTAIRSISDNPPVSTEVPASDEDRLTTVALDFGEMTLDSGEVVHLFGVPGQGRFDFIWPMISDGALGTLFFLDARHPEPLKELDMYLDNFSAMLSGACVLLVTQGDRANHGFDLRRFEEHLRQRRTPMAVIRIDPRQRNDVLYAINVLLETMPETAVENSQAV